MEYVSKSLRNYFREFCVGLALRQIDIIFDSAGIQPSTIDPEILGNMSGERRIRVEEHYASINWENLADTRKFLKAMSLALSQTYLIEDEKERLRKVCKSEGLIVDEDQIRLGINVGIGMLVEAESGYDRAQFSIYYERIQQSLYNDPEAAIGSAKELVEAVAKYILQETGQEPPKEDFPKLLKLATSALGLSTDSIPESAKGSAAIKQILSAFNQIVGGMAELRNLYGTGHGRLKSSGSVKPRHAKLAVSAAITLCTFLLETLEDRTGV